MTRICIMLLLLAVPLRAQSQDISQNNPYSFGSSNLEAADRSCRSFGYLALTKTFDGVSRIVFDYPDYWESAITGYSFFSYSVIHVSSNFGDVFGYMTCAWHSSSQKVVETSFHFSGKGLAGSSDPLLKLIKPPVRTTSFIMSTAKS